MKHGDAKPVDITAYDVEKCFDSLWLKECINDLYDTGIKDDRLALVYESNSNNQIAINTPVGQTDRIDIGEVVMQGSSWGSIMCSNSVGQIGGDSLTSAKRAHELPKGHSTSVGDKRAHGIPESEYFIYKYKNEVELSSLEMCCPTETQLSL